MKFLKLIAIISYCFNFYSCHNYQKDAEKYLPGTYQFQFPSGEIEILKINPDFSYSQKIFTKDSIKILYQSNGRMQLDKRQLEFYNWLVYCKYRYPDQILKKPHHGVMADVYWDKPNKNNKNTTISIYAETGYIFQKIN